MNSIRTFKEANTLITGAGSGLGRALAVELARRGARVFLSDIDVAGLQESVAQIERVGGTSTMDRIDVRDAGAVQEWVERAGRVDYLFNNAGIPGEGGFSDRYGPADWKAIVDVNLMGVVNGVHAGYAVMVRQGFGHIVNTASLAGLIPMPLALGYSATKHAVMGITKSLRVEAAARGVRVSVLCPGAILTPILTASRLRGMENVSADRILAMWQAFKPITADVWARESLNRVARNEAVIVVPRFARFVAGLYRFFPFLGDRFSRASFADLVHAFPELEQARRLQNPESNAPVTERKSA